MKKTIYLFTVLLLLAGISLTSYAQVEVKGSGTTSATATFISKNASNTVSVYVRDDGNVGIGTTSPTTTLDVNGLIYTASGVQFSDLSILTSANVPKYARVITVAKSGGDFTTINAAFGSIGGPINSANPYLIRVMPGTYPENVQCRQYVHLKGAGKYSTTITGTITATDHCVIEDFRILGGITCISTSPTIIHNIITNVTPAGDGILVTSPGYPAFPHVGRPWIKENEIMYCSGWGISVLDFESMPWIIANKIYKNGTSPSAGGGGGIFLGNSSPTISNNIIDSNYFFGIYLQGTENFPSEPTIDDNQIGHTYLNQSFPGPNGIGIYMRDYAEPRVISNDIYVNRCGIFIDINASLIGPAPSIIGNDIEYNWEVGIRCFSRGMPGAKRVVITSNHIHKNGNGTQGGPAPVSPAGIFVSNANPMITLNNITENDQNPQNPPLIPDIDYNPLLGGPFPTINQNTVDIIFNSGGGAFGSFNATSLGVIIAP